ncbi:MAG: hypothetical protein EOP47_28465 [Sphingobacteriaceae bacterium]|nr:MAG: hypothetical protein EOP47_28465 [Sphingobacteriaceae bacterium]
MGHLHTTLHHNFFYNTSERNPCTRFGYMHVFNNYLKDVSGYGVGVTVDATVRTDNNYFEKVVRPIFTKFNSKPGFVSGESTNFFDEATGKTEISTSPSTWTPKRDYGYAAYLTSPQQAKIDVLDHAGPDYTKN